MANDIAPEVNVSRDENGIIREIDHSEKPYVNQNFLEMPTARQLAKQYLIDFHDSFQFQDDVLESIDEPNKGFRAPTGTRLFFKREKKIQEISIVQYEQAYNGIPVWNSSVSVRVNNDLNHVFAARNGMHYDIDLGRQAPDDFGLYSIDSESVKSILGLTNANALSIKALREIIYQYRPDDRTDHHPSENIFEADAPSLDLGDAPDIADGQHRLCIEVLFSYALPDWGDLNWRTFIDAQTGAVLYLRALVSCVHGSIFQIDPVTQGCPTCTGGTAAATLDNFRTTLPLPGLTPPTAGNNQSLIGEYISVQDIDAPAIAPPTEPVGTDFSYSSTTDNFSAVNAYFHCDFVFRYIDGFGIDVPTYFGGTTFPVPTDFRGKNNQVNASCNGNAAGDGVGKLLFGLVQGGQPVGIATALRVVLHEFGHALLWNHVDSPNFGFAHSAGDSLACIYADPFSEVPDKGLTFPFLTNSNPTVSRRNDRTIAAGWAWFGSQYNTGYNGEQVLSTTLFRAYQFTGGGSDDLSYKLFASQYMFYLIVKSCGLLTQMTTDPVVYVNALKQADMNTADFQGNAGGTNYKVIRWCFEQQGLFQAPGTPHPITTVGQPPEVDVYVNDGRNGAYQYLADWKNSPAIWNRTSQDGRTSNQDPIPGQPNFIYVDVSNRGTQSATNIVLKGYQAALGSQGNWPVDWAPMTTASLTDSTPLASNGTTTLGPFEWIPNSNTASVLMVASATNDASIVDNPVIAGKTIPNWRLVPFDNNIAQRSFGTSSSMS